jgi:bacterioferritin (cytochrome b1)
LPLFSKRRKKDLLDQYISLGLTKPETVPIRMTYEQRKKMYEYVDQSLVDWEWHTKEQHTQWLNEQQKLVDNAISESYKRKSANTQSDCSRTNSNSPTWQP